MSETTKIEWATSTCNPWIGCTKVSPGCKNCYAETLDRQRFSRTMGGGTKENPVSHWGPRAPRLRTKGFWKDAVKWDKAAAQELADWKQSIAHYTDGPKDAVRRGFPKPTRPRIFPSLCDIWDPEVQIELLADFAELIFATPNLDYLLLTKRPELALIRIHEARDKCFYGARPMMQAWLDGKPPSNVWIGTSVEDQQRADERIPELLKIPAKVRFLSVEPMLGPIDMRLTYSIGITQDANTIRGNEIHWVIVGGESGPGARLCNIEWVRSIVRQCKSAQVPCFVKQLGSVPVSPGLSDQHGVKVHKFKHPKGGDMNEWPEDCRVRQFPKLASGSL